MPFARIPNMQQEQSGISLSYSKLESCIVSAIICFTVQPLGASASYDEILCITYHNNKLIIK